MSQQFDLDRFEKWFIARKARQLAGKAGFTPDDVEDIEQDIRFDLWQRLPRFNKKKANRHTFVALIVHRCALTILERRRAAKRNYGRRPRSLNAPVRDDEGHEVELYQTLDARVGQDGRSEEELHDLRRDVREVVGGLTADQRRWCSILGKMGIREASRTLHVPRTRLQRIVRALRKTFTRSGIQLYLPGHE